MEVAIRDLKLKITADPINTGYVYFQLKFPEDEDYFPDELYSLDDLETLCGAKGQELSEDIREFISQYLEVAMGGRMRVPGSDETEDAYVHASSYLRQKTENYPQINV